MVNQGERNLPKPSVVLVSQVFTVDKSQIGEFIGRLAERRVKQILAGLSLLTEPRHLE